MNRQHSDFVKAKVNATVYREQDEDYGLDPVPISAGTTLHVAVEDEVQKLEGKRVRAAFFTIGTASGWYWMPRHEFDRVTEKFDVREQTGIPFER